MPICEVPNAQPGKVGPGHFLFGDGPTNETKVIDNLTAHLVLPTLCELAEANPRGIRS